MLSAAVKERKAVAGDDSDGSGSADQTEAGEGDGADAIKAEKLKRKRDSSASGDEKEEVDEKEEPVGEAVPHMEPHLATNARDAKKRCCTSPRIGVTVPDSGPCCAVAVQLLCC